MKYDVWDLLQNNTGEEEKRLTMSKELLNLGDECMVVQYTKTVHF